MADRDSGAAMRRRQRRPRPWWRHEQQSFAAVLATVSHHSYSKVDIANAARRGQKIGTSTGVGLAEYFELSSDDGRPAGWERPAALREPRTQGRVQRRTVSPSSTSCPTFRFSMCPCRSWEPAGAIHAEARHCDPPCRLSQCPRSLWSKSHSVLCAEGGTVGGSSYKPCLGLQSFFTEQNSTASVAEQIVEIPVPRGRRDGGLRPRQVSTASSSTPGAVDEAFHGFFSHFSQISKNAESRQVEFPRLALIK